MLHMEHNRDFRSTVNLKQAFHVEHMSTCVPCGAERFLAGVTGQDSTSGREGTMAASVYK